MSLYETYQQQIAACDAQIETYLNHLPSPLPPNEQPQPKVVRKAVQNQPTFDLATHLHRISGVDFCAIDGLGPLTVQTILSEVGLDPTRFGSAQRFASWLGLCPGSAISGGKRKSSKTRRVSNRAANAFRIAAMAAGKSDSAIGAFFRRLKARLGAPKAITATAHKLARIFYHLWSTGQSYDDVGAEHYEQQYRQRKLKYLQKQAAALGLELSQAPTGETLTQVVS